MQHHIVVQLGNMPRACYWFIVLHKIWWTILMERERNLTSFFTIWLVYNVWDYQHQNLPVKVEGTVQKVFDEGSEMYFHSCPQGCHLWNQIWFVVLSLSFYKSNLFYYTLDWEDFNICLSIVHCYSWKAAFKDLEEDTLIGQFVWGMLSL